jgi:hypothetical protein
MKSYAADTPLNSATITPKKEYVILGGGEDAMGVTNTSSRQGKFEARFYHKIFEEEIGRVRGHFGASHSLSTRLPLTNINRSFEYSSSRPNRKRLRKWRRRWIR